MRRASPVRRASGFSLVELMVAIVLALIVTAGAIAVFVGSRTAYQSTAGVAAVTDGGRIAMSLLEQDVRNAGYIACAETMYPWDTANTPGGLQDGPIMLDDLVGAAGSLAYDFRFGLGGYEATGTAPGDNLMVPAAPAVDGANGDWAPALDATFTNGSVVPGPTQTAGSDVLVLRSSLPATPAYASATIPVGATTFTVNGPGGLQAGQIAAVSDCAKQALVFQVAATPAGAAGAVPVSLSTNGADVPGNVAGASIIRPFEPGSVVMPLTTNVYYIGKGSDGDYALKRLALNAPGAAPGQFTDEEVVPDVDNMQVLYGVATTQYAPASQYVTADNVADFRQVVSVEIALLAATPPGSGTGPPVAQSYNLLGTTVQLANDNRQRRVFQFTVAIRNQTP